MQLYILDTDPVKSAQLIPDKYKFKMLIELGQLICSAGLSNVYKPIAQGKELQQWVKDNPYWISSYFNFLFEWSINHINMSSETFKKLNELSSFKFNIDYSVTSPPIQAHFRYASAYECPIPSKTLLPIEVCIEAYKEYLQWKLNGTA